MKDVLNDLLDKLLTLEYNAQMNIGASIEEETAWDDVNGTQLMGYKLSEGVVTTAEFLQLIEIVGSILEILGAKK